MQASRPEWGLVFGCALAFLAALTNVAFVLELETSVSHLTGDLSRLALQLAEPDPASSASGLRVALALAGFVVGAATASL